MATVKFYLKKLSSGEASVMLRFLIDRNNKFKLATGERIDPIFWDKKKQEAKAKYPDQFLFNQSLTKIKGDIIQLYRDNKSKSVLELKEMARPLIKFDQASIPEKKSLTNVLTVYIKWCKKERDPKTAKKFETLQTVLLSFNPNLVIDKLDNNFYDRFKDHLFDLGMLDSTVYKYFKNLCTFLTWADSRGHEIHKTNDKPTHLSWEIIERRNEPITLTHQELETLQKLNITQELIDEKLPPEKHGRREYTVEAMKRTRLYLILECRTCQRISDVKKFDLKDVEGYIWSNRVTKGRRLNAKVVRVPFNTLFTAPAWELLREYNFELPQISEKSLNKNIKNLCRIAGITQFVTVTKWKRNQEIKITKEKCDWITTHTGRKTFITIGLQYMQPKLVKDLAGISWGTLKHYEGQSEDHTIQEGLNSIPMLKIAN